MNILLLKRVDELHKHFGYSDEQYSFPEIEPLSPCPQGVCLSPSLSDTHKSARTHMFILSFSDPAHVYIFFYTDTKKLTTPASWGGVVTEQGAFLSKESVVRTEP